MVELKDMKERSEEMGEIIMRDWDWRRMSCESQLIIPETTGTTPDLAGNSTDRRFSTLNQESCTPDISWPLVSSIWLLSSFPISLAHPQLYHPSKNTKLSHHSLFLHAIIVSQHRVQ
jgi:hypothetical protein